MINRRLALHNVLQGIIGVRPDGKMNVYFQSPATVKMNYPCIVYGRSDVSAIFADNIPYKNQVRYQITVIDPDPDSVIPSKVAVLPTCIFDRHFTADNLNHDVYNLYY